MSYYSYSKLNCFEQCPLKFKFIYIDKLEPEFRDSIESFLGCRVHESLEKLYSDLKFEKCLSEKELIAFYNKRWSEAWHDEIKFVKDYSEENYRLMGERYLIDFYKRCYPFNDGKTVEIESAFTVAIDESNENNFHIRIDRLSLDDDGYYVIHDYKTSNSMPDDEFFDNDRQLTLYAYGVRQKYPDAKKMRVVWHMLAFNQEVVRELNDEVIEKAREKTLCMIDKIENCREFNAFESKLCDWCGFHRHCPKFKHLYLENFSKEDGRELVDKYAELSEEIKEKNTELERLKEKIVSYADKFEVDNVYGENMKVYVRKFSSMKFPGKSDSKRNEFIDRIKDKGYWEIVSTVDNYELAKLINKGEIEARELEEFITYVDNPRIYLKKRY